MALVRSARRCSSTPAPPCTRGPTPASRKCCSRSRARRYLLILKSCVWPCPQWDGKVEVLPIRPEEVFQIKQLVCARGKRGLCVSGWNGRKQDPSHEPSLSSLVQEAPEMTKTRALYGSCAVHDCGPTHSAPHRWLDVGRVPTCFVGSCSQPIVPIVRGDWRRITHLMAQPEARSPT